MPSISVIDFETDGEGPPAPVIETGRCDLIQGANGWDIVPRDSALWHGPVRLDPKARAVHHISPLDLAGKPPFEPAAFIASLAADGAIIVAAHAWDIAEGKWLTPDVLGPIRPLCTYKAALRVWPDAPSHSNGALRYWLEDEGLTKPQHALTQPAHRAGPDAYMTAWLLKALLERVTAREMCGWTREPALLPRCPISEKQGWQGKKWSELDGGALQWITSKPDMGVDVKFCAQRELDRRAADQRPAQEAI